MEGGEREVEGVRGGGVEGVNGWVREDGRYVHTVHRYFDDASKSKIKVKTIETARAATGAQTKEKFDHVIFACHPHQALAMIGKKTPRRKSWRFYRIFRTTRK